MKNGLVQIYTGDGKGKTTAAIGLAIRAAGRGMKTILIQFLKGETSGEINYIRNNVSEITVKQFNSSHKCTWNMNSEEIKILAQETKQGIKYVQNCIQENEFDIIILDEIIGALNKNLVSFEEIKNIIKNKPTNIEIVLTGRNADSRLIELADLVSKIKKLKHPFDKNIKAREGIEK